MERLILEEELVRASWCDTVERLFDRPWCYLGNLSSDPCSIFLYEYCSSKRQRKHSKAVVCNTEIKMLRYCYVARDDRQFAVYIGACSECPWVYWTAANRNQQIPLAEM